MESKLLSTRSRAGFTTDLPTSTGDVLLRLGAFVVAILLACPGHLWKRLTVDTGGKAKEGRVADENKLISRGIVDQLGKGLLFVAPETGGPY